MKRRVHHKTLAQVVREAIDAYIGEPVTAQAQRVADLLVDTDVFIDVLRGARRLDVTGQRVWIHW